MVTPVVSLRSAPLHHLSPPLLIWNDHPKVCTPHICEKSIISNSQQLPGTPYQERCHNTVHHPYSGAGLSSSCPPALFYLPLGLGVIASIGADGFGYQELRTEEGLVAFALADEVLVWVTGRGERVFKFPGCVQW